MPSHGKSTGLISHSKLAIPHTKSLRAQRVKTFFDRINKIERIKVMKRNWLPQAVAGGMLLWALYPGNPSGYYTLLHWFCCGTLIYLACRAVSQKRQTWVWILVITALVYNPIFRLHFKGDLWSVINVITSVIVVVSIFALKSREKE